MDIFRDADTVLPKHTSRKGLWTPFIRGHGELASRTVVDSEFLWSVATYAEIKRCFGSIFGQIFGRTGHYTVPHAFQVVTVGLRELLEREVPRLVVRQVHFGAFRPA